MGRRDFRDALCVPLSSRRSRHAASKRASKSIEMLAGEQPSSSGNSSGAGAGAGAGAGRLSRAQSTGSLSKRKSRPSPGNGSVELLETQYKLCQSLLELSVPRPLLLTDEPQDDELDGRRSANRRRRDRRRRPESCIDLCKASDSAYRSQSPRSASPVSSGSSASNCNASGRARSPDTLSRRHRLTSLSHVELREAKMVLRSTRALQEHVKDATRGSKRSLDEPLPGKASPAANLLTSVRPIPNHGLPGEPGKFITDKVSNVVYQRGKLLGKGGFARCYELTERHSGKKFACKIVNKQRLMKPHQMDKILREVELHRNLHHRNIVAFHSYFEDSDNVYILLELCNRKSLVHVLKVRRTLTEPEVRYYIRQLISALQHIRERRIIHRDLKLGNMLLNEAMEVKVADFGLATKLSYIGEKKMTVCGTPNYIAPEVLQKIGHSYEADIWAVGCIMYAMLVGHPPFETATLKETYMRISANRYVIPPQVSLAASDLIVRLLQSEPSARPSLETILQHDFFFSGHIPPALNTACCHSAPKFPVSSLMVNNRSKSVLPSTESVKQVTKSMAQLSTSRSDGTRSKSSSKGSLAKSSNMSSQNLLGSQNLLSSQNMGSQNLLGSKSDLLGDLASSRSEIGSRAELRPNRAQKEGNSFGDSTRRNGSEWTDVIDGQKEATDAPIGSAIRLYQLLKQCLLKMPFLEKQSPPLTNVKPLWVTKWVDYSNKYGFGFQLSDKRVGVLFNDRTRMLLMPGGQTVLYNDLSNKVYSFTVEGGVPKQYSKKSALLLYFAQYMDEHLIHGGSVGNVNSQADCLSNAIFMKKWFRTPEAIVMYLNSGTLQVNFLDDHTKVILSPNEKDYLVTYINEDRNSATHNLLQLGKMGCHPDINKRLQYAVTMLQNIINIEGEAV